jgi:antitoxin ParD1/3/4
MVLSLTPEMQEFVQSKVKSGAFPSADDVIRAGIATLMQQETLSLSQDEFEPFVAEGEESVEQDGMLDGEEVYQRLQERSRRKQRGEP